MSSAQPTVLVDRGNDPYRWRCPNNHTSWDRTNNHIWCPSCSRAAENGADVSPEHWELLDKKTGEAVPWAAVRRAADA